jgi:3-methyladenine DNA glycosylase Tag
MERLIEVPPRVSPQDDSGYLEELTKAIFRSGFSWRVVREKWDNFRRGFDGFDVAKVASYEAEDIIRLFNDPSIIRNRRKILATVENAQTMLDLVAEHGSFHGYLRSLDHLDYQARVRVLTGWFWGLGRTGAFVFLHCVNEETPSWQER